MPKNVKGGTLWDFVNIHSVAKSQKIDGGPFGATTKKLGKNGKYGQSHSAEKKEGKGTLLLWNGFSSHVRGFGCVENEVLSTYGKSA